MLRRGEDYDKMDDLHDPQLIRHSAISSRPYRKLKVPKRMDDFVCHATFSAEIPEPTDIMKLKKCISDQGLTK